MKKSKRITWAQGALLLILAAGIGYAVSNGLSETRGDAAIGNPAPEFALPDASGAVIQLKDFQGQRVLLNFWASWCHSCVNEMPLLNEAYKLTNIHMLAVNIGEDEETVRQFAERYGLKMPIVLDAGGDVLKAYQAVGLKPKPGGESGRCRINKSSG